MGRKKIYKTEEDKKDAQRKWEREYYIRNKEKICKKAREKYKQKKLEELNRKKNLNLYGE